MKIVIMIFACLLTGYLSGIVSSSGSSEWYEQLNKPSFQPPSYLFGPVWTVLYILMGIAAGMVWIKTGKINAMSPAWIFFFLQLALNFLWSLLFFGIQSPQLALVDIVLLLAAIILTIKYFFGINHWSGILLLPYIFWVGFATILNASIWWMNR